MLSRSQRARHAAFACEPRFLSGVLTDVLGLVSLALGQGHESPVDGLVQAGVLAEEVVGHDCRRTAAGIIKVQPGDGSALSECVHTLAVSNEVIIYSMINQDSADPCRKRSMPRLATGQASASHHPGILPPKRPRGRKSHAKSSGTIR
jgi:hypothetical protein